MAKKKAKKKASKKPTRTRKKPSRPAAKASGGKSGEFAVKTGAGLGPMELGHQLVSLFNQGKADQWIEGVWDRSIESVEGVGMNKGWRGIQAVQAKNQGWMMTHVVHGASAEGPYVGSSGFAVKFRMDVEDKSTGQRQTMEEVGVYSVRNGKITREEFMYSVG